MARAMLPLGYKANGLACGIKQSGRLDLGLIFSEKPAVAAGMFTANKITSGSVRFCQDNLYKSKSFHAILINSGNANCFTKEDSFGRASRVADEVARFLRIEQQEVLLASTGIIGKPLPIRRITRAVPRLVKGLSRDGLFRTAEAIMTTDTFIKILSIRKNIGNRRVTICGLAKGAGMIAPDLDYNKATMLCFILSDANISQRLLDKALRKVVDNSFNCITVDGCMSTNDTLLVLSNACAGNSIIKEKGADFDKFLSGLNYICLGLAKMIVEDAEGASKFIQIKIKEARTYYEARRIALSIANSNLFKTAVYGGSRNWGRVIAAIGSSGVSVKESDIRIRMSSLRKKRVSLEVNLRKGAAQATIYTSDLTPEYVKINAGYS